MGLERVGKWLVAAKLLKGAGKILKPAITKSVRQEAQFFRTKIVRGITKQKPGGKPFLPLAPNTLKTRRAQRFRGSKALIRTGGLRNAITVVNLGDAAFVGILRSARSTDGEDLHNIARIHEFGRGPFLVPITKASRSFLGAAGVQPVPSRVAVITIPARPFIAPVFEKFGKPAVARRRMLRRLSINTKKQFGRF